MKVIIGILQRVFVLLLVVLVLLLSIPMSVFAANVDVGDYEESFVYEPYENNEPQESQESQEEFSSEYDSSEVQQETINTIFSETTSINESTLNNKKKSFASVGSSKIQKAVFNTKEASDKYNDVYLKGTVLSAEFKLDKTKLNEDVNSMSVKIDGILLDRKLLQYANGVLKVDLKNQTFNDGTHKYNVSVEYEKEQEPVEDSTGETTVPVGVQYQTEILEDYFYYDTTAPSVSNISYSPSQWTNDKVIMSFFVNDTVSGVKAVTYNGKAVPSSGGKYSITFTDYQTANSKVIIATDNLGNSKETSFGEIKIDKKAPVISDVQQISGWTKTNQKITFKVTDQDPSSGIKSVIAKRDSLLFNDDKDCTDKGNGEYEVTLLKSGNYILTATDEAGNSTTYNKLKIQNDTVPPTIESISFSKKDESGFDKFLHIITFGIYSNDNIVMTVKAKDTFGDKQDIDDVSSFIKGSAVLVNGEDNVISIGEDNPVEYKEDKKILGYTIESKYELKSDNSFDVTKINIIATDAAGNSSQQVNLNAIKDKIVVSNGLVLTDQFELVAKNTFPTVSDLILKPSSGSTEYIEKIKKGEEIIENQWFSKSCDLNFSVQDINTGIHSVIVKLNGNKVYGNYEILDGETTETGTVPDEYSHFDAPNGGKKINSEIAISVDTAKVDQNFVYEGKNVFEVIVISNNGNESVTIPKVFFIDTKAPEITSIKFEKNIQSTHSKETVSPLESSIEPTELDSKDSVVKTSYGYFIKETTNVLTSVNDDSEKIKGSQAKTVTLVTVTREGERKEETKDWNPKDNILFTIEGGFKGRIYVYATDNLDNKGKEFVPENVVIETEKEHEADASINIILPETPYCDNNGNNLYSSEQEITITAKDTISGIAKVYYVIGHSDNDKAYTGTLSVGIDGDLCDSNGLQWNAKKENNLIVEVYCKNIPVEFNYNDITINSTLTDRAEYTTDADTKKMSIDKTKPEIKVSYDNNSVDSGKYFKNTRTATISVKERNFSGHDLKINEQLIINSLDNSTNARNLKLSSWKVVNKGTGNGDDKTQQATISFTRDDEYVFKNLHYRDLAQNKCEFNEVSPAGPNGSNTEAVAAYDFVIDLIDPVITVSYDNNAAANGKYFNRPRTATITIVEHNFDESRVTVNPKSASISGGSVAFPSYSFTSNGDVHTATLHYASDGDYQFDVTCKDKAGRDSGPANYGGSVAGKDFTVDQTIVAPTISGVENGKAYKSDFSIGISFSDINYASHTIKLTRTVLGKKNVDVTSQFIKNFSVNGTSGSGKGNTIPKVQANDGVYSLTVVLNDLAGNTAQTSITFIVNRFGSVYVYSDNLIELIANGGEYVRYDSIKDDFAVTEYNPDKLVKDSLKINATKDGTLLDEVKYTSSPVINDKVSRGSTGWYEYKYTIRKDNFAEDGLYNLILESKDNSGNKPQNISNGGDKIVFRIDNTVPEILSVVGLEDSIVNADSVDVQYSVFDAIGLDSVSVLVDGIEVQAEKDFVDLNSYDGQFTIKQKNQKQHVEIKVVDKAGNSLDTEEATFVPVYKFAKDVIVSTNFFVRWYANTALFWGSIGGAAVIIAGAILIITSRKKK